MKNEIIKNELITFMKAFLKGFANPYIIILCICSGVISLLFILSLFVGIYSDLIPWYEPVAVIFATILANFLMVKTSISCGKQSNKLED